MTWVKCPHNRLASPHVPPAIFILLPTPRSKNHPLPLLSISGMGVTTPWTTPPMKKWTPSPCGTGSLEYHSLSGQNTAVWHTRAGSALGGGWPSVGHVTGPLGCATPAEASAKWGSMTTCHTDWMAQLLCWPLVHHEGNDLRLGMRSPNVPFHSNWGNVANVGWARKSGPNPTASISLVCTCNIGCTGNPVYR